MGAPHSGGNPTLFLPQIYPSLVRTRSVSVHTKHSFCNISSRYESEMITHVNKYKCTHIIEKITDYTYQMNQEIIEMKKDGYILNCLAMADF